MELNAKLWELVIYMSRIEVTQFKYFSDNYGFLVHDKHCGKTIAIDAGDANSYNKALDEKGWHLSEIWVTHHHWDHTDGIDGLYKRWRCKVVGPANHSTIPISHLSEGMIEGDSFLFAEAPVKILHTPGHTLDMINFYLPSENILFSGDTLFSLGCGKVFEGNMEMMYESLTKISTLPNKTKIYCSHEYTKANGKFALVIEPKNEDLISRFDEVKKLVNSDKPTIPTNLELEKKTNPFLRTSSPSIREKLNLPNAGDSEVFSALREAKDKF